MFATTKNQRYKVYQDIFTRQDFEGKATVQSQLGEPNADGYFLCEVEFDDEPGRSFQRAVHPDDQIFD